jgi:uncharacterized membrane protein
MAVPIIALLILLLVVFPVWTILRIRRLERRNEELEERLRAWERTRDHARESAPAAPAAPAPTDSSSPAVAVPSPPNVITAPPVIAAASSAPPPFPAPPRVTQLPASPEAPPPRVSAPPSRNWEQFTGAKLFAWIGGLTAFLGAAFFIKYSFERDLIPPALRATIGYAFALSLIAGGLLIPRRRYATTAQTLCATGIVSLYAVTFACGSLYAFEWFTPMRTFLLMAANTAGAFLLAVRLGAQVVAVLGILGGFLTPILLSTGRDNTAGLFGYLALLDAGLIAVALRQRWRFLVPLGAAGTIAFLVGWASKFLSPTRAPTAMLICLVFCGLFLVAHLTARRLRGSGPEFLFPALALPALALLFGLTFVGYRSIAAQPALLFGFIFAVDACLLALAWWDEDAPWAHLIGGLGAFALLSVWTGARLTPDLLNWALGLCLLYGALHTAFPLLLHRRHPGRSGLGWSQLFPPLALALMLVPLVRLEDVSWALWPCVLLVDVLAIGLALVTGAIAVVAVALLFTLAATVLWLFQLPVTHTSEPLLLLVTAGFALLFFGAGILFARRFPAEGANSAGPLGDTRAHLPAFSALLPFLLLVMMVQRLPTANPSSVFGVSLLLTVLSLGLTRLLRVPWLPACALAGSSVLAFAWEARHGTPTLLSAPVAWYLIHYAVFSLFPFVFRARFAAVTGPWATAALAGLMPFFLLHGITERTFAAPVMGLVPAAFAVVPLASLFLLRREPPMDEPARLAQTARFGGAALFFLTLIIPIQFERQWITLGWALEGAALLWLFHRVPHPGLRATGVALLVAAFVRLALNPAVLEYHARAATPIFNWYLYTYGTAIACLFVGARLLAPPRDRAFGVRQPPLLITLGTVLTFLLLNIEIADFFSRPGTRVLTFQFSGNFARDMTYTIAWALFALGLLLVSIWRHTRAGRFAALGLLGVTVAKLFFHDLARLGALHRIGALFAVAVIAIVASLAYQRWVPGEEPPRQPGRR